MRRGRVAGRPPDRGPGLDGPAGRMAGEAATRCLGPSWLQRNVGGSGAAGQFSAARKVGKKMETEGLEPSTPALQRRCSPN